MKKILPILAAVLIGLSFQGGCAFSGSSDGTTQPAVYADSHDQIVIKSEQAQQIAASTFDLLDDLEYKNRDLLASTSPVIGAQLRAYTDVIRRNGIGYIKTLRDITRAYKHNRSAENKASVSSALAVVQEAINQSRQYIDKSGLKGP
jgi:hypothetical protein